MQARCCGQRAALPVAYTAPHKGLQSSVGRPSKWPPKPLSTGLPIFSVGGARSVCAATYCLGPYEQQRAYHPIANAQHFVNLQSFRCRSSCAAQATTELQPRRRWAIVKNRTPMRRGRLRPARIPLSRNFAWESVDPELTPKLPQHDALASAVAQHRLVFDVHLLVDVQSRPRWNFVRRRRQVGRRGSELEAATAIAPGWRCGQLGRKGNEEF